MSYHDALDDLAMRLIDENYSGIVAENVSITVDIDQGVINDSYWGDEPASIDVTVDFQSIKRNKLVPHRITKSYSNQIEFLKELLGE